jgi:hypothetical protein
MKMRLVLLLLVFLVPASVLAQDTPPTARMSIGGIDTRIPPMQSQFLSDQIGRMANEMAKSGLNWRYLVKISRLAKMITRLSGHG